MAYPIFVLVQGLDTATNAFTISNLGDVVAAGNVTASKFTGTVVGSVTGNIVAGTISTNSIAVRNAVTSGTLQANTSVTSGSVATNSIVCNNAITATLGFVKSGDKFIVGTTNGITTDVNANTTTNCRFVITGGIITAATQY
jgi:hypothetical protein